MTALFAQWEKEDPITGPEDAAARQREGDELMAALQTNRFNLEGRTDFTQFRNDADGAYLALTTAEVRFAAGL